MGYTASEIAAILRGEQVLIAVAGTLIGLVAGVGMTHLVSIAYDTELYRFPVVIYPSRLLYASLCMFAFIGAAQLIIRSIIGRMNWADAIKVNE